MGLIFEAFDDYLQMEGLASQQLAWGRDAICVSTMAGLEPVSVNIPAPADLVESSLVPDSELLTKVADWGADHDMALFTELGAGLNGGAFCDTGSMESVLEGNFVQTPDATRTDTTLVRMSACSELSSLVDEMSSFVKGVTPPGSPDSGICSPAAVLSPGSDVTSEVAASPEQTPALHATKEDIALLESLWRGEPDASEMARCSEPQIGAQALLTAVTLYPSRYSKLSPASKGAEPTKTLTADRKERKRAQNKNAATRYRDKKRAEALAIFQEQTVLEEKNKCLQDKVTLITRELQCMKELLVEVYRAKGIIK